MEHNAETSLELDDAISALQEESKILDNDNPSTTASRYIDQNAPFAAVNLVHLARSAVSETVRLNATKEILQRSLGPANEQTNKNDKDPFEKFLERMEAFAGHDQREEAQAQADLPVKREA